MKRKRTIRRMTPTARKIQYAINDAQSALKRLENLVPEMVRLEMDSMVLYRASQQMQRPEEIPDEQAELFPDEGGA